MDNHIHEFNHRRYRRPIIACSLMVMALCWAAAPVDARKRGNPGFYEGSLFMAVTSGGALESGGTLLDFEREYNASLRTRAEAGLVNFSWHPLRINIPDSARMPVVGFESETKDMAVFSLDFGLTNHIGIGFTWLSYEVNGRQQDSIAAEFAVLTGSAADISSTMQTVFPQPVKYELYKGTSLLGSLTYHFLSHSRLDPYVAMRLGFSRFTSDAHASLEPDRGGMFRSGGRGVAPTIGAGLGMNIFLSPEVGFRMELSALSHRLKTASFKRTLHSGFVEFGMVFNIDRMD